ncbi:hypothetical protein A2U01_0000989 [Trifolium medium]|uniref:Transposase (putative) gypsy type domain-containing protein n=1 Tax=Trifolium medium TaxID=97028 RepID=A0A392M0V5_9FABA|nr:hypothetical protein [Trifolium medium]
MVILRDLDDEEGSSTKFPLPGSSWERQARAHFTRADGSLNSSGYYYEIWGFPVSSSDNFDSDSDSSSGSSSDCVIISPSSFIGKQKNMCRSLVVADLAFTTMEVRSKFTTTEIVELFRKAINLSGSDDESGVITEPVGENEFVTTVNTQPPHYFYMYTNLIQALNIWFPFTPFEGLMLKTLNVAPNQLHPNGWAFINAFEVMCLGFELEPSVGVFFSFYHIKNLTPNTLETVAFLETFNLMDINDLINKEGKKIALEEYLQRMRTISNEDRLKFLARTRQKKNEPEAAVIDPLSQLLVEDEAIKGGKRKRKNEMRRIYVHVPTKGEASAAGGGVEETVQPSPKKRKGPTVSKG